MRNDNRPEGYSESTGRRQGTLEEMSHVLGIEMASPWIKQELGVSAGSPEEAQAGEGMSHTSESDKCWDIPV